MMKSFRWKMDRPGPAYGVSACGGPVVLLLAMGALFISYSGTTEVGWSLVHVRNMTPDAAISLLFLALGTTCVYGGLTRLPLLLALVPFGLPLVALAEYFFSVNLVSDQIIQATAAGISGGDALRMAPNTSVAMLLLSIILVLFCVGKQSRLLASAQVLSVAVLSLAVGVIAGHLFSLAPLDEWYGLTRMSPSTALGTTVLSTTFLLRSRFLLQNRGIDPNHYNPALSLAVGVALSAALCQALLVENTERWESIVHSEAGELADRTRTEWRNQIKALDRLASRWTFDSEVSEVEWRQDAVNYIRDFNGLMAFAYSSLDFNVLWVETHTSFDERFLAPVVRLEETRQTVERCDELGESRVSSSFKLPNDRWYVLTITPIPDSAEVDGRFASIYDLERMMRDVFPAEEVPKFRVRVLEKGEQVYTTHAKSESLTESLRVFAPVLINGVDWDLEVIPTNVYFSASQSNLASLVFILGLMMSAALSWSLHQRNRARSLAAVHAQTSQELSLEVAERQHAQAVLADQEEHIRTLLDSTGEAIYGIDMEGRCTFCNAACISMLGYENESALMGQDMHSLVHHTRADGSPYSRLQCRIYRAFVKKVKVHADSEVFWRADGTSFPVEYWSQPLRRHGVVSGAVVTFIDITLRRAAQEALRVSEERFDLAVRGASDGLWDWDLPSNRVWYSERFRELLGYAGEEDFSSEFESFARILHPEDRERTMEAVHQHLEQHVPYDIEYRLRHSDGAYRWFRARGICIRDSDGRPTRMAGSVQDVSERRNMLQELEGLNTSLLERTRELEQRNQEVEAFVYIVSHDLRAPLVNIQGFCLELKNSCQDLQTIAEDASMSPAIATRLEHVVKEDIPGALHYITAGTTKFERLIDALLRLSRTGRQTYCFEKLNTHELVEQTVASLSKIIEQENATVTIESLPEAYGDYTAIGQVFGNLIGNALNYLRAGVPGKIAVGGENEHASQKLHFWVRDNGTGVPLAARERIFQVFQRAHPEKCDGEGMGLAIVKRIVERHGGEIWLESEVGQGTTFHFSLAYKSTTAAETLLEE